MGLGERIGTLAKEKHISLRKLALDSDIGYSALYAFVKRDGNQLAGDKLERIAQSLDLSIETLLGTGKEVEKYEYTPAEAALWDTIDYSIAEMLTDDDREEILYLTNSYLKALSGIIRKTYWAIKKGEKKDV